MKTSNVAKYVTVLDSMSGIVCVYSIDHEVPELWAKGLYYDSKSSNEYYEFER